MRQRRSARPVKWTDERSTSFLSDSHGRGQLIHAELALDADGKFLAVRLSGYGNLGAYITGVAPSPLSLNTGKNLASVYRTPLLGVDIKTVLTNTTLMGAYRGAGRPEANYYMERLIDRAADEMGINRLTLRKKNFIKPAQMPFAAASGVTYDSGDFQAVFSKALEISDYANFAKRKKESRKQGKLRGIAVGSYLEVTAPPSRRTRQDHLRSRWRGDLDHRHARLWPGPRHAVRPGADRPARRALRQDQAGAERQRPRPLRQRHRRLTLDHRDRNWRSWKRRSSSSRRASRPPRICWRPPKATSNSPTAASPSPAPTARIDIMELARRMREGKMPEGVPASLDVDHATKDTPSTFPNGCHVAEVEIDPETGVVQVVRYTGVNDFGTVINPMIVAGQLHGGVAQGIGQALMECISYDSQRPADHRLVHGLRDAARRRHPADGGRRSSGAGQIQSAGHQGLRRSRLRRQPLDHRQRGARCAVRVRHQAYQHAADPGAGLARDPGCEDEGGVRADFATLPPSVYPCHRPRRRAIQYSQSSRDSSREAAAYWFPAFAGMTAEQVPASPP